MPGRRVLIALGLVDVVGDRDQLRAGQIVGETLPLLVVHALAPERQASASGTTWSMSTSEAAVQVAPSYGEYQRPEVAAHAESVTTEVPSRLRTVSRVLQLPLMPLRGCCSFSEGAGEAVDGLVHEVGWGGGVGEA